MKFSYNWLKELSETKKSPQELAEFLTLRAFEVEEVVPVGFSTVNVFVGEVLSIERHPNADRLRVAKVSLGDQGERTIVCGAPNLDVKQRVAVAVPGAKLPGGVEISEAEIRGVHSQGMICSEKELGLGDGHEGILVLPEGAEVGIALSDFLRSSDWLLDVKILPDRAHDCLSHVGLAREIASLERREFDYDYDGLALPEMKENAPFSVSLDAGDKSLRYVGVLLRNVSVGTSPKWLIDRLGVFGMRSINTVVDATNLIMLELGQPLHAFDWDALSGGEMKTIGPRFAKQGETIVLLDGKTYELGSEDIVIADREKAIALGGIMGGADSAVTNETRNVFFEAAHFDPIAIRRTRTRLGIESDASYRFEKGISPDMPGRAMARILDVISHIAGGEVVGIIDECKEFSLPESVTFSPEDIRSLLGGDISTGDMQEILRLRGCSVSLEGKRFSVTPPPYRLDIVSIADVAEEIGKGIGYDRIDSQAPMFSLELVSEDPIRTTETTLRDIFSTNGFTEIYNYSFYSEKNAGRARLDVSKHCMLENPLNPDQALVRMTLLPGLLGTVVSNQRRFPNLRLFECGKTYEKTDAGDSVETRFCSGVATVSPESNEASAFRLLQSMLVRLFELSGASLSFRPCLESHSFWHPTRVADMISASGTVIGSVGEIHPGVAKSFGISGRVAFFECDVRKLLAALPLDRSYIPIRKYPETLRDLSFFVPRKTLVSDVVRTIRSSGEGLVLGVEVFDRYVDPERGKSLAVHIRLGKEEGTVSGEEADRVLLGVARRIEEEIGGSIRRE